MATKVYLYKNQFIYTVLQAFHLQMDGFMYNLVHHHTYEIILYRWILKLYDNRASIEKAILTIYKARNMFLLKDTSCMTRDSNTPKI